MKAEIIAVGTEILMGQIVNTNAAYLSQELNALGFDLYYETVVGDNPKRLLETLGQAKKRSDLIVLSGGLGPTTDDLTKQTVAVFLDKPLEENQAALEKIKRMIQTSGRKFTENNRLQALTIVGGTPLKNPKGMAIGTLIKNEDTYYLLLPGPPVELKSMFQESAVPLLKKILPQAQHLYSETLRFYGIGESQLVTQLQELIATQTNPTIAPYAKENEVTLRITAQSEDKNTGLQKIAVMKQAVLNLVGQYYYGSGEDFTLEQAVVEKLKAKQFTITAAESLTAGLFQSTLSSVAGVSEVFPGGLVTYAKETKANQLGIPLTDLNEHGVVSEFTAEKMAENVRKIFETTLAISFTGAAGPDPLEGQEPGSVWLSLAQENQPTKSIFRNFNGDRNKVRRHCVKEGLWLILQNI